MADVGDQAHQVSEFFLRTSLADCDRALMVAQATGRCLWCNEPLADGRRWCDAECRDEWERHQ